MSFKRPVVYSIPKVSLNFIPTNEICSNVSPAQHRKPLLNASANIFVPSSFVNSNKGVNYKRKPLYEST